MACAGEEAIEAAPEPAEPEKPEFEEGLLMSVDFGDANHELSYVDIKATFENIAYVEFQKASPSKLLLYCV